MRSRQPGEGHKHKFSAMSRRCNGAPNMSAGAAGRQKHVELQEFGFQCVVQEVDRAELRKVGRDGNPAYQLAKDVCGHGKGACMAILLSCAQTEPEKVHEAGCSPLFCGRPACNACGPRGGCETHAYSCAAFQEHTHTASQHRESDHAIQVRAKQSPIWGIACACTAQNTYTARNGQLALLGLGGHMAPCALPLAPKRATNMCCARDVIACHALGDMAQWHQKRSLAKGPTLSFGSACSF